MSDSFVEIERLPNSSISSCYKPSYGIVAGEVPEMNTAMVNSILNDQTSVPTDILVGGDLNTDLVLDDYSDISGENSDFDLSGGSSLSSDLSTDFSDNTFEDLKTDDVTTSLAAGVIDDLNTEDITTSLAAGVIDDLNTEDITTSLAAGVIDDLNTEDITTSLAAGAVEDLNTEDITTSLVAGFNDVESLYPGELSSIEGGEDSDASDDFVSLYPDGLDLEGGADLESVTISELESLYPTYL